MYSLSSVSIDESMFLLLKVYVRQWKDFIDHMIGQILFLIINLSGFDIECCTHVSNDLRLQKRRKLTRAVWILNFARILPDFQADMQSARKLRKLFGFLNFPRTQKKATLVIHSRFFASTRSRLNAFIIGFRADNQSFESVNTTGSPSFEFVIENRFVRLHKP